MFRGLRIGWYFWYNLRFSNSLLGSVWFIFLEYWVNDMFLVFFFNFLLVCWWVCVFVWGSIRVFVFVFESVCVLVIMGREESLEDKEGEIREGKEKRRKDYGGFVRRRLFGFVYFFIYGLGFCVWYFFRFWEYYSYLER